MHLESHTIVEKCTTASDTLHGLLSSWSFVARSDSEFRLSFSLSLGGHQNPAPRDRALVWNDVRRAVADAYLKVVRDCRGLQGC